MHDTVYMEFHEIKALIHDDFQAVERLILSALESRAQIINDIGSYLVQNGGKRLRSIVLLLIAKACHYQGKAHHHLAAIVELIHTATLLHDDVVDDAPLRRGQKAANQLWGNRAAILAGDFLYSKAFLMMGHVTSPFLMPVLVDATQAMAESEALQLSDGFKAEISETSYFEAIRAKTGKLFEAAAILGALLNDEAHTAFREPMARYGMHLGTAFQLIDDVLDYQSPTSQMGKRTGNDFYEGKMTLPLIYILQQGKPREIDLVNEALLQRDEKQFGLIQKLIETTGAIAYTVGAAKKEMVRAIEALSVLPESPYRRGAEALARFAVERQH